MTTCPAARHGDALAYMVDACRHPAARESYRLYRKRLREGRHPPAYVPSVGPARRLRALALLGHSLPAIADALGMTKHDVYKIRAAYYPTIRLVKATRIEILFDRLTTRPPGRSSRAVAHARQAGWAPPWAWDGAVFAIDDPTADDRLAAQTVGMAPLLRRTVRDETLAERARTAELAATSRATLARNRATRWTLTERSSA